ncbi:MAG: hypothetical protein WAZ18_02070 [Alphaproteobacteria bacterium]
MTYKPMLITVSGMSGVGKDSVVMGLCKLDNTLRRVPSATTRPQRPDEIEAVDYYFMGREKFLKAKENGDIPEVSDYHGNLYGAWLPAIREHMNQGLSPIKDWTWSGVEYFQRDFPQETFSVLVMPPSRERLFQRLTKRNPEKAEDGKRRFKAAEEDLDHLNDPFHIFTNPDMRGSKLTDYDAVFVNDDLEVTVYAVAKRIAEERQKRGG